MKTKTLILALVLVFSTASFAQFKNPFGGGGDDDKQEQSSGDITQIQTELLNDIADALSEVTEAQALIADAQGNAEKAAQLRNTSKTLKGGANRDEAIQGAVQTVKETAESRKQVLMLLKACQLNLKVYMRRHCYHMLSQLQKQQC